MSALGDFIKDLCDEMEILIPDWEDCEICAPVIPYLRKYKDSNAQTPTRIRVRSLMREMRNISPEKYKIFNDRFRSISL